MYSNYFNNLLLNKNSATNHLSITFIYLSVNWFGWSQQYLCYSNKSASSQGLSTSNTKYSLIYCVYYDYFIYVYLVFIRPSKIFICTISVKRNLSINKITKTDHKNKTLSISIMITLMIIRASEGAWGCRHSQQKEVWGFLNK